MQKTRQKIVEYLKQHGSASVDELSDVLGNLTAVTVRHHLDVLRREGLVSSPEVHHRDKPGRPKYLYSLTEKADVLFPNNYRPLAHAMLDEIRDSLPKEQAQILFDGVAARMAADFDREALASASPVEKLEHVVEHLTEQGYQARWEKRPEGYVLHTGNCPYAGVAGAHGAVCFLDARYLEYLLGFSPQRIAHIVDGELTCSYLLDFDA